MYRYGRVLDATEESKLREAKALVVLWSLKVSKSIAFRAPLDIKGRPATAHVLLEEFYPRDLPGHELSFDFSDWDGAESYAEMQSLLSHLRTLINPSSAPAKPLVSFEELSLSEIQESARLGIEASTAALTKDDARFSGVFISYRRSEAAAYAGRLYDRLAARFGKDRIFFDHENVGWGEDFIEAITAAAESCAVMIALISREWSRGAGGHADLDDYVRLEVATALGRKIRVIPILIQGASMPAPKELPEDLSPLVRRNALALSDNRWERDVEDLMKTLEGLLKD
ncbi:MAG TPA: toll/interleukin-1 receptor domain-containing protein [Pyrinomonadaceae bacterium]|nr:toll/interleukin-1 receptor domain-containing protein [Pyrinomonadaceae bacterium]